MAPKQGKKNLAKFLGIDMSAVADSKCAPSDNGKLTGIEPSRDCNAADLLLKPTLLLSQEAPLLMQRA